MSHDEFLEKIASEDFHVFLFDRPVTPPFHFLKHSWLVVAAHGQFQRWEVKDFLNKKRESLGYIHLDSLPPTQAYGRPLFGGKGKFRTRLLAHVQGGHGSLAEQMSKLISSNAASYPHKHLYRYIPGPNSNTFIQWILDQVPEFKYALAPTALGRGYK